MKNLITRILCITVIFLFTLAPYCFAGWGNVRKTIDMETNKDKVDSAQIDNKETPYSHISTLEQGKAEVKTSNEETKATVTGLKDAGFSVDAIVNNLKNGGKNASEISVACLGCNISGAAVHAALIKSGFSKESADSVVPAGLINQESEASIAQSQTGNTLSEVTAPLISDLVFVPMDNNVGEVSASVGEVASVGLNDTKQEALQFAKDELGEMPQKPELKGRGFFSKIIRILVFRIKVINKMKKAEKTSKKMVENGYSSAEIGHAFAGIGYSQRQTAILLKTSGFSTEEAYTGLLESTDIWQGAEEKTIAKSMIEAGYNETEVDAALIGSLKKQGYTAQEVVNTIFSDMPEQPKAKALSGWRGIMVRILRTVYNRNMEVKVQKAEKAAQNMIRSGYSSEEVKGAFRNAGFNDTNAVKILNAIGA
ncbi:MAG: hypothetical protein GY853_03680 [PVC group bacterium]|nr:hypothetical protein [PVC group bacterium]